MNLIVKKSEYFRDKKNRLHETERAIEWPIAERFYKEFGKDNFIEIGSVLENIGYIDHPVIDLSESKSNYHIKEDALKHDYHDKSVLSISTLEHVGDFESAKGLDRTLDSIKLFEKIHDQSKRYLITFPVGYTWYQPYQFNPLDKYIEQNCKKYEIFIYIKTAGTNCVAKDIYTTPMWKIAKDIDPDFFKFNYNCPYVGANILICIYKNINFKPLFI